MVNEALRDPPDGPSDALTCGSAQRPRLDELSLGFFALRTQKLVAVSTAAHHIAQPAKIPGIAPDEDPRARARLFCAMVDLYRKRGDSLSDGERAMMGEILLGLARQVELRLRQTLAEALAESPNAPIDVILLLANDEIAIAAPILERSPALASSDLAALASALGEAHQMAIARRAELPEEPALVLARNGIAAVLHVLLENASAHIPDEAFRLIAARAEAEPCLQEPLVRRGDLPGEIAAKLSGIVGGRLRAALEASGKVAGAEIDRAMDEARARPDGVTVYAGDTKAAERLVEKLYAAGQLTNGFLIKALNGRQMSIFEHGFAKLAGLSHAQARKILYEAGTVTLATACRALRMDPMIFRAIVRGLAASKEYVADRVALSDPRIGGIFESLSPTEAQEHVRQSCAA